MADEPKLLAVANPPVYDSGMTQRAFEEDGKRARGSPAGGSRSGRKRSLIAGFGRLVRYRVIIPLKRSRHPPEHTARGVMVGLVWGFTPTVGIQMPLVFVTWLVTRRLIKWDFSVIIAMAWTWITNVVTIGPIYYAFYLTGQVMLGRGGEATGYSAFRELWDGAFRSAGGVDADDTFHSGFDWFWTYFTEVIGDWGLAMAVGSVPWAVLIGWLGYVWSLRFVIRHREARQRRRLARLARLAGGAPRSRISRLVRRRDRDSG